MSSKLKRAVERNLIKPPGFVHGNLQYEVITGSYAYGTSNETSDMDIYGWCIPPKEYIFPHINGYIKGFDDQVQGFDQFQEHHIIDKEALKEYDFTIFSIVKYFKLCMDCNPNMVDTLFVPNNCVLNMTKIGQLVRDNRHMFLCKKAWYKFKGYAYSQMRKMRDKEPEGKRKLLVDKYGYDTKYAGHLVRLLLEVEEILLEGDLTLNRNREQLKAIREGQWTEEQVLDFFQAKEKSLESFYTGSKLPYSPREEEIKQLLVNCLEEHFGSLEGLAMKKQDSNKLKEEILAVLERY
jgi:predicted nucleotidyltransferase